MEKHSLNGVWKIRWSTGQRGGTPYALKHEDEHERFHEVRGITRELPGKYNERGWLDKECVLKAVNFGDDIIIAAIAGGLTVALYGYEYILQE